MTGMVPHRYSNTEHIFGSDLANLDTQQAYWVMP